MLAPLQNTENDFFFWLEIGDKVPSVYGYSYCTCSGHAVDIMLNTQLLYLCLRLDTKKVCSQGELHVELLLLFIPYQI